MVHENVVQLRKRKKEEKEEKEETEKNKAKEEESMLPGVLSALTAGAVVVASTYFFGKSKKDSQSLNKIEGKVIEIRRDLSDDGIPDGLFRDITWFLERWDLIFRDLTDQGKDGLYSSICLAAGLGGICVGLINRMPWLTYTSVAGLTYGACLKVYRLAIGDVKESDTVKDLRTEILRLQLKYN